MNTGAVRILLPFLLGPALVLGPAAYMRADAAGTGDPDEMILEASAADAGTDTDSVTDAASDLYEKADRAISSVDKETVRQQIREALDQLDELGISPSKIAERTFGTRTNAAGADSFGSRLADDAKDAVRKQSENMFQSLWDRIMGGAADLAGTIIRSVEEAVSGKAGG